MADVLEAMGFPSDWCEKALSSSSGIETAVDLLLQWQAQGNPPLISPSLGSGSPRQGACSPSRPTLKLHPIPSGADSKGRADEGEASPSSTLRSACTSSGPSSSSGPSGVDETTAIKSPVVVSPRDVTSGLPAMRGFVSPGRNAASLTETSDRITKSSISYAADARAGSVRAAGSSRVAQNAENSDAVVPDAFAEERRSRYAAAQRAKQEKEAQKAKIRQQLQEDKAQRRLRHSVMPPSDPSAVSMGKQPSGSPNMPVGVAANADAPTHLQIRCPRNQVIKGSFTGGTSLKEVRAYVERHLQGSPLFMVNREDSDRPVSVPFTGSSSRLSSDWEAERTLMQAARENFEAQTSRIIASARTLRQTGSSTGAEGENQARGTMYFLIPIPRREFFTESAMESTLAEAQLVPSGTLIVQYRRCEPEVGNNTSNEVQGSNITFEQLDEGENRFGRGRVTEVGLNYTEAEPVEPESPEAESGHELKGPAQPKKVSLSSEGGRNGASNSGRSSLEIDGERVRARELALQAAARRMSEAARIFREGIPLGEGETGGAFPFPNDGDQYGFHVAPAENAFTALERSARTGPEEFIPAGADAERVDASAHARDRSSSGIPGSDRGRDRSLDALHRQAVAAAEARLRSSHCQPAVLVDSPFEEQELKEAASVVALDGRISPQRSRARVPPTSRLLSRPEKLQRRCDSPTNCNPGTRDAFTNHPEEEPHGSGNPLAQSSGPSYAGPLEAALGRLNARAQPDTKGKGPVVEEDEASRMATAPSSHQLHEERQIALRVRFEDGRVQTLSFPADTLLQSVRDSVVPDGVDASTYGFFINVPEPHYVEGDDLQVSLEAAGLASREIVHLLKMSSRGMVRQGRRAQYRRRRYVAVDDDDEYTSAGVVEGFTDPQERRDLTYEELMDLEESIGRVHVGVPEEMIAALPVHTVKSRKRDEVITGDGQEEDVDVCIICMAEMVDGDEALTLPCVHTFHPLCIRRWLHQSTSCPTCKYGVI